MLKKNRLMKYLYVILLCLSFSMVSCTASKTTPSSPPTTEDKEEVKKEVKCLYCGGMNSSTSTTCGLCNAPIEKD